MRLISYTFCFLCVSTLTGLGFDWLLKNADRLICQGDVTSHMEDGMRCSFQSARGNNYDIISMHVYVLAVKYDVRCSISFPCVCYAYNSEMVFGVRPWAFCNIYTYQVSDAVLIRAYKYYAYEGAGYFVYAVRKRA